VQKTSNYDRQTALLGGGSMIWEWVRLVTGSGGQKSPSGVQGQDPSRGYLQVILQWCTLGKKQNNMLSTKHCRWPFYNGGKRERVHPNPMNPLDINMAEIKSDT